MYSYNPAISKRGTSWPGARVSAAAGLGNGVGLGVAGNANTPLVATGLLLPTALPPPAVLLDVALFSLFAAFVVSSPAPLLFCCAHSGKANSPLITNAAHQSRISTLLSSLIESRLIHAPACAPLAVSWPNA